jgi:hypothetical protein
LPENIAVETLTHDQTDNEVFYKYYWRLKNCSKLSNPEKSFKHSPNLFSKSIALEKD